MLHSMWCVYLVVGVVVGVCGIWHVGCMACGVCGKRCVAAGVHGRWSV